MGKTSRFDDPGCEKMKKRTKFHKGIPHSTVLLVLLCSALLLGFVFFSNYRTLQGNIQAMEQGAIAEICRTAESLFSQANTVASAMSLNSIGSAITDLTREEYIKYNSTQQLLHISLAMNSYISGITVHNTEHSIAVGTGVWIDAEDAQQLSTGKAFQVYLSSEKANSLLCVLNANPAGHTQNDVYISLNTYDMGRTIFEASSKNRCELVVDAQGYIVISDRTDYFGKNAFELFELSPIDFGESANTVFVGNGTIVSCAPLNNLSLYALTISNTDYYLSQYNTTVQESVLLACLLICVMIIACFIISKIAYRPIQKVLSLLKKFSPATDGDFIDEIDYINETITAMHSTNSDLSRTVDENISELKKQQLAALQAQISPHFLFNTLDAVNWVAVDALGIENVVSACLQKTKRILRSGIDSYHFFATVEDEIACSTDCLDILKLRYDIDFSVYINLTDEQMKCRILRNCLQPILENAVFHGFTGRTVENAAIHIDATEQDGDLTISIRNNGAPVTKKQLEEIILLINDAEDSSSDHVGLRNVHRRLQLLFGDQYGLSFAWSEAQGFTCNITLPFVK